MTRSVLIFLYCTLQYCTQLTELSVGHWTGKTFLMWDRWLMFNGTLNTNGCYIMQHIYLQGNTWVISCNKDIFCCFLEHVLINWQHISCQVTPLNTGWTRRVWRSWGCKLPWLYFQKQVFCSLRVKMLNVATAWHLCQSFLYFVQMTYPSFLNLVTRRVLGQKLTNG